MDHLHPLETAGDQSALAALAGLAVAVPAVGRALSEEFHLPAEIAWDLAYLE
jgi:hypothetical protein